MTRDEFLVRLNDFNNHLDVARDDWQMRLVMADMLEEFGEPDERRMGPGYRALAAIRFVPNFGPNEGVWLYTNTGPTTLGQVVRLNTTVIGGSADPLNGRAQVPFWWWASTWYANDSRGIPFRARRQMEDALARGFVHDQPGIDNELRRASVLALLNAVPPVATVATVPDTRSEARKRKDRRAARGD